MQTVRESSYLGEVEAESEQRGEKRERSIRQQAPLRSKETYGTGRSLLA